MRIVLLTTARGQQPEALEAATSQLGLAPGDGAHVTLVGWHPPRCPLPVTEHLVVGPSLSLVDRARQVPVLDAGARVRPCPDEADPGAGAEVLAAEQEADPAATPLTGEPESVEDLTPADTGEQVPPAPRGGTSGAQAPAATEDPLPPLHDPRRLARALQWRARRARRAVRTHPAVQRVRGSARLRRLRNRVAPGSLGSRYAVACLRSASVRGLVDGADLVVAMDANTHRAAWLLARRHPRPAVVAGLAAGKPVVEGLRSQRAVQPGG